MTWFKVDDSFHSHPKVMAVDPAALGLWVIAGSWCSAGLTDGFIPDYALPRLAAGAARLAGKLVAAGLWSQVEGGYQFHDWLQANPTAESEKDRKAKTAKRQREFRERSNALRDASRTPSRNGGSNGAPSRPVPDVTEVTSTTRARAAPRPSTTDQRVQAALALADRYEAADHTQREITT